MSRHASFLEKDALAFAEGTSLRCYRAFGAHVLEDGVFFAVWVPHARTVRVVGDFNGWKDSHEMLQMGSSGVWTLFVKDLGEYQPYKYQITSSDNRIWLKSDPFAFFSEPGPGMPSVTYRLDGFAWSEEDEQWLSLRGEEALCELNDVVLERSQLSPVNIYEVHMGSWKRHEDQSVYTYRELAQELVPYVRDLGYTHIQLMPVMEHVVDEESGFQIVGYYSLDSRFGTPHDFMFFVDACHQAGLGVILDWVPGCFFRDEYGLCRFNGDFLYEDEQSGDSGSLRFDFSRGHVWSFLISNALYYFDVFHIDGLRIDATRILYKNGSMNGADHHYTAVFSGESSHSSVAMPESSVAMPESSVAMPESSVAMPESSVAMPEPSVAMPDDEDNGFHSQWSLNNSEGGIYSKLHDLMFDDSWGDARTGKLRSGDEADSAEGLDVAEEWDAMGGADPADEVEPVDRTEPAGEVDLEAGVGSEKGVSLERGFDPEEEVDAVLPLWEIDPGGADFVRALNLVVRKRYPGTLLLAEDQGGWQDVTLPVEDEGLGFDFKLDLGWRSDFLRYGAMDFSWRAAHHRLISFSSLYLFAENSVLPFSHEFFLQEEPSLIDRQAGDYGQKFAGLRALYCYYLAHPGKKMSFMGTELAQFVPWNVREGLEWYMGEYDKHRMFRDFIQKANHFYLSQSALWAEDVSWDGFSWIDADNAKQSVLCFVRKARRFDDQLVVVLNLSPSSYDRFRIGVPTVYEEECWRVSEPQSRIRYFEEVFCSDATDFGGSGKTNGARIFVDHIPWNDCKESVALDLPALSGLFLKPGRV